MLALIDIQTEMQQSLADARDPGALIETMERLRHDCAETLLAKIAEVATVARVLAESERHDAALTGLRNLAYKLAGSGATFGFSEMGKTAGKLEHLSDRALDQGGTLSDRSRQELLDCVVALQRVAALGMDSAIVSLLPAPAAKDEPSAVLEAGQDRPIILVEDDDVLAM